MADFQKMMAQAQQVQQEMQKAQQEIAQLKIVGSAGAGAVKVTINGQYAALAVNILDSLMHEPKDMIEQLVAAAFNDAVQKLERVSKERLTKLTSSINLEDIMKANEGGDAQQ